MDSENLERKRPRNYAGSLKDICTQTSGLLRSTVDTPLCQINSRTSGSSLLLRQEDCINGTSEILGGTERATTLFLGAMTMEVCSEDTGVASSKLWHQELYEPLNQMSLHCSKGPSYPL